MKIYYFQDWVVEVFYSLSMNLKLQYTFISNLIICYFKYKLNELKNEKMNWYIYLQDQVVWSVWFTFNASDIAIPPSFPILLSVILKMSWMNWKMKIWIEIFTFKIELCEVLIHFQCIWYCNNSFFSNLAIFQIDWFQMIWFFE